MESREPNFCISPRCTVPRLAPALRRQPRPPEPFSAARTVLRAACAALLLALPLAAYPAGSDTVVDTTAPALESATVNGVSLVLTWDDELDETSAPEADAFTVYVTPDGGTEETRALETTGPVTVEGATVTFTLAYPVVGGDTVTVSYVVPTGADPNPIRDVAENNAAALTKRAVTNETNDTTAPVLQTATVNGDLLVLTYDEALDTNSTPWEGDFTVYVTPSGGTETRRALRSLVTVSGMTVTLELANRVVHSDTVLISYSPSWGPWAAPIQDLRWNPAAEFFDYAVTHDMPDTTAPVLQTATVNGASLVLTWDEALDTNSTPAAHDFTVYVTPKGGTEVERNLAMGSPVTVSGTTVTLTLASAVVHTDMVTVSYVVPAGGGANPIRNAAEIDAAALTRRAVTNDTAAPVPLVRVLSAAVTSDAGTNGTWDAGETIEAAVRFSGPVTVTGGAPVLTVVLERARYRRAAAYTGGSGTDTLTFAYTVTATDRGTARKARIAGNGLAPGGAVIADSQGRAVETGFAVAPWVNAVVLLPDASGDRRWTAGETMEVWLAFSEAVTVADGTPAVAVAGVAAGTDAARTLAYASGSGSRTLVFTGEMGDGEDALSELALAADSLALDGTSLVSQDSGLAAALGHRGTSATLAPESDPALTARFEGVPQGHAESAFTFRLLVSEEIAGLTGERIRDSIVQVNHGVATAARRVTQGSNREWAVTVEPSAGLDVTIYVFRLACERREALCADGWRMLAETVSATVSGEALAQAAPLTVGFAASPPGEHDGSGAFTFRIAFSENLDEYSYSTLRDTSLTVMQGAARLTPTKVARVYRNPARANTAWTVEVTPQSKEDIAIGLGPSPACDAAGAMCTADGRVLSNALAQTVLGPPGLSVADATVREAEGATMDFVVTLSRASVSTVTVRYATSAGSAAAGSDYTEQTGTLTFAPEETSQTVAVAVLNDDHDDGGETFTLTLSHPAGGNAYLADATATGTIENTGPMPRAWLGRFGRTVAGQVLDAVEGRFAAVRAPGAQVSLAGAVLGGGGEDARAAFEEGEAGARLEALSRWVDGAADASGTGRAESRALTGEDFLTGTAFTVTGGTPEGGYASVWGRGATSGFDGREGELTLDGEVASAMLGADVSRDIGAVGLMLTLSRGEGRYRGAHAGEVKSTLTGLYPYGRYALSERVAVWGVAGYGEGTLTLQPKGAAAMEADMRLMMGAVGVRGVVVEAPGAGGVELAVTSDAMAVRTTSERTTGMMDAEADVTRLRLGLEGTWHGLGTGGGGQLVPRLELGVRHDGGDAETGLGADIGAGLAWSHPASGLTAQLDARGLLAHEDGGLRERGVAGSLGWDPRPESDRGFSASLRQTTGAQASGGMDALLGRETLAGLARSGDGDGDAVDARRLELRVGYGLGVLGDRFTATPELGVGVSDTHRELSLGWRLGDAGGGPVSMEFGVEGTRRESANGEGEAEHALMLRGSVRW